MPAEKINLLLIEDTEADARMFLELMKDIPNNPVYIHHVENMSQAISYLLKEPVDIIVTDLNLGDSRGIDTVETLLKISTVPIIVLTGLDQHGLVFKVLERGAYDYFIKGELNGVWIFHVLMRAFYEKGRVIETNTKINLDNERNKFLIDQATTELRRAKENLDKIQTTLTELEKEVAKPLKKIMAQV